MFKPIEESEQDPCVAHQDTEVPSTTAQLDQDVSIPNGPLPVSSECICSYPGAVIGHVPNVYLNGISTKHLRMHPRYQALPPVKAIDLNVSGSSQFVRQDSPTWERLHSGALTTGILLDALGFRERVAGKRLGMCKNEISHARLVDAFHRLRAAGGACDGTKHPTSESNLKVTRDYNRPDTRGNECGDGSSCSSDSDEEEGDGTTARDLGSGSETRETGPQAAETQGRDAHVARKPRGSKRNHKKAHGRVGRAGAGGAGSSTNSRMDLPKVVSGRAAPPAMRQAAASLAAKGIHSVRCAWGIVQEPGTLHSVLDMFRQSEMKEVGLCMVDVDALPAEWGLSPSDLPLIGASPDGVIHHPGFSSVGHPLVPSQSSCTPWACECAATPCMKEVVEVKNLCPFEECPSGPKRRGRPLYSLLQRRAPHKVPAKYVPQVQLEMLATGTMSALIALDTPHNGLTLFRMHRSNEYLQQMLYTLSRFYTRYVKSAQVPPEDMFVGEPFYRSLLHQTILLRESAVCLGNKDNSSRFCKSLKGECYNNNPFVDLKLDS